MTCTKCSNGWIDYTVNYDPDAGTLTPIYGLDAARARLNRTNVNLVYKFDCACRKEGDGAPNVHPGNCPHCGKQAMAVCTDGVVPCECLEHDANAMIERAFIRSRFGQAIDADMVMGVERAKKGHGDGPLTLAIRNGAAGWARDKAKGLMVTGATGTCKTLYASMLYNDHVRYTGNVTGAIKITEFEFFGQATRRQDEWDLYTNRLHSSGLVVLDNWFSVAATKQPIGEGLIAALAVVRYQEFMDFIYRTAGAGPLWVITTREGPEALLKRGRDWDDMVRRIREVFTEIST